MRRVIASLAIFAGIVFLVIGTFMFMLLRNQQTVLNETIEPIEFQTLTDGIYEGTYHGTRWENTVRVTIAEGKIIAIEVLDDMMIVDDFVQAQLFIRVKEAESLDVDAISGATISSTAYLKAIEDALLQAKK